jgi:hypothetical protein
LRFVVVPEGSPTGKDVSLEWRVQTDGRIARIEDIVIELEHASSTRLLPPRHEKPKVVRRARDRSADIAFEKVELVEVVRRAAQSAGDPAGLIFDAAADVRPGVLRGNVDDP